MVDFLVKKLGADVNKPRIRPSEGGRCVYMLQEWMLENVQSGVYKKCLQNVLGLLLQRSPGKPTETPFVVWWA
eukprot:9222036-Pyramimonas_sp.AAC.1